MFNSGLKKENEELKSENKMLKGKVYKLENENAIDRATYEAEIKGFENKIKNLKKENKKLFTYDDAIRIVNSRLSYIEDKFKEVKKELTAAFENFTLDSGTYLYEFIVFDWNPFTAS